MRNVTAVISVVCLMLGCHDGTASRSLESNASAVGDQQVAVPFDVAPLGDSDAETNTLDPSVSDVGIVDEASVDMSEPNGLDGPRMAYVVVGHRFSEAVGVAGRGLSLWTLDENGVLNSSATRLTADHAVTALDFVPNSKHFLVTSEDGSITNFRVEGTTALVHSRGQLDAAGVVTVRGAPTRTAAVISRDSSDTGGIYWYETDGQLDAPLFLPMSLAYTAEYCEQSAQWVVVGGQTTFEPVRPNDIHTVTVSQDGATFESSGDITDDIFEAKTVAVTRDCRYAVYANRQVFSDTFGRLFLVDVSSESPRLLHFLDTNEDIGDVQYLPTLDVFVVGSFESETLSAYVIEDQRLVRKRQLQGLGLISGITALPLDNGVQLIIGSIDAREGSRLGRLTVDKEGRFGPVEWYPLPEGGQHIPSMLSTSGWLPINE